MAAGEYLTVPHLTRRQIARLFKTIIVNPANGCWLWTGRDNGHGYGRTFVFGRQESIHRVMYAWLVEPIPRGLGKHIPQLDHRCRTRRCANPAHLILTTARANNMSGESVCAQHARQTHCKYGHLLAGSNVMKYGKAKHHRACRKCHNKAQREMKRRKRRLAGLNERGTYRSKPRLHKDF